MILILRRDGQYPSRRKINHFSRICKENRKNLYEFPEKIRLDEVMVIAKIAVIAEIVDIRLFSWGCRYRFRVFAFFIDIR